MSYQALARKWRPQRFEELVGQEHIVRALQHGLAKDRLHHALLFSGTRGVGKTTLGRLVAKGLNCEQGVTADPCGTCAVCISIEQGRFVDLIEVDAASRTGVDDTRELLNNVQYAPALGRYKVYLIDEVHMLSKAAFNALLKTLEEPPPHVRFLLATTDPQKLPITVLSRCLQFHLKRLPRKEIQQRLNDILSNENIVFEPDATALLAQAADGSLRDGISLLDQAIAFGHGELKTAEVGDMLGTIARRDVLGLLQALASHDGAALMAAIDHLDDQAPDYEAVLNALAAVLQRLAVMQCVPDYVAEDDDAGELRPLADEFSPEQVQLLYQIAITAKRDLPLAPDPRSGFEMTLLRMLAFDVAAPGATSNDTGMAPSRQQQSLARKTESPRAALEPEQQHKPSPPMQVEESVPAPAAEKISVNASPGAASEAVPAVSADAWASIVDSLGLAALADQLARYSAWSDFRDQTFHLQLAPEHEMLFGERHQATLLDALRKRFGADVGLVIEHVEPTAATPAMLADSNARERQQQAEQALANDPRVMALRERLGAQIHPGSIEALDIQD